MSEDNYAYKQMMKAGYGKGWRNEPARHSLSAMGVKTGRLVKPKAPKYQIMTIRKKIYSYKNAPKELKEKIREKWIEHDDVPQLRDDMKWLLDDILSRNKIKPVGEPSVLYDLSYSQGSGATFEGRFEYKGLDFSVTHSGRYYHERSADVSLNDNEKSEKMTEAQKDKAYDDFKAKVVEIGSELGKRGYRMLEEAQSEQSLKETFEANDYRFDESGNIAR